MFSRKRQKQNQPEFHWRIQRREWKQCSSVKKKSNKIASSLDNEEIQGFLIILFRCRSWLKYTRFATKQWSLQNVYSLINFCNETKRLKTFKFPIFFENFVVECARENKPVASRKVFTKMIILHDTVQHLVHSTQRHSVTHSIQCHFLRTPYSLYFNSITHYFSTSKGI